MGDPSAYVAQIWEVFAAVAALVLFALITRLGEK